MDKQCVFRCQFNGRNFSVFEQDNPKEEGGKIYWVYEGRRKLDKFNWFSEAGAIGSILSEFSEDFMSYLSRIWS